MDRIEATLDLVEDLRELAARLESLARAVENNLEGPCSNEEGASSFKMEDASKKAVTVEKEYPFEKEGDDEDAVTIEEVREALTEKYRCGKQSEVKSLITKYGAGKLTGIYPACYPEFLAEVLAL